MQAVEAISVIIDGKQGYDIRVNDPEATVQDYIDAVERFIADNRMHRGRKPVQESCYGCDLCCRERIPVTLIDALNLTDRTITETLTSKMHVLVDGQVVDITMGLDETGSCRNLDADRGLCRDYQRRPLVCRTFICCPATRKARQLREEIVNMGEDELVRTWFSLCEETGSLIIHEGCSPDPCPDDYAETPFFQAAGYHQVKLRDICSPGLWRELTIP